MIVQAKMDRNLPDDPLRFIQECVEARQIYWTYHVNMRLKARSIPRSWIVNSVGAYEIIESYPEDKYLPSYLVRTEVDGNVFHILFAADVVEENVRVVTAYKPDPAEWTEDMKRRWTP